MLVAIVALTLGSLLVFEHTRNLVKVRGPYLMVLMVIGTFPIFAFRSDPHEDARPITGYFLVAAFYYIMLGSPDFVAFFRMLILERLPPGSVKTTAARHRGARRLRRRSALRAATVVKKLNDFRTLSAIRFPVCRVRWRLDLYLNYLIPFVRMRFGILTIFS